MRWLSSLRLYLSSPSSSCCVSSLPPPPASSSSSASSFSRSSHCRPPLFSGSLLLVLGGGLLLRALLLLFLLQSRGHRAAAPSPAAEALLAPSAASFASFQEALTRYSLHISPYSGGAYRQQPLVFFALQSLTVIESDDDSCQSSSCKSRYFLLLSLLDLVIALSLAVVAAEARAWTAAWSSEPQAQHELPAQQQQDQQNQRQQDTIPVLSQQENERRPPEKPEELLTEQQQQQLRRRLLLPTEQQQQQGDAEDVQKDLLSSRRDTAQATHSSEWEGKRQPAADGADALSSAAWAAAAVPHAHSPPTTGAAAATKKTPGDIIASPALVAACYFLQPLALATLLALSIHTLPLAVFAAALAAASKADNAFARLLCVLLYGLLLYVGPPQALLLALPLAVLMRSVRRDTVYVKALTSVLPSIRQELLPAFLSGVLMLLAGLFICCCLHVASFYALGGAQDPSVAMYFDETVVAVWGVRDTSPNLGIFWYTFALVFARYRSLFAILFQGHSFFAVLPLAVRLYRHPLALCIAVASVALLFQPSFCVSDSAFVLALLSSRQQVVRESSSFVKLMVISLLSALVYPVMVELWLGRNTGNANFVFSLQLIHLIVTSFLLVQWVRTIMSREELTSVYSEVTDTSAVVARGQRDNQRCIGRSSAGSGCSCTLDS